MNLLVCDLDGRPRGHAELVGFQATSALSDPGEADFTVRASPTLYQWLSPWQGMLVLTDSTNRQVLWSGVPVKRRGEVGSGTLTVIAREWTHWLTRVAPLIFDSGEVPFDGYGDYEGFDGVTAGFVVKDLMDRVPQNRPGLRQCPLRAPSEFSGGRVVLGEPDVDVSRGSVWQMLQPVRDVGVEMWARTTLEDGLYVPRMVVGSPRLGDESPTPLWLGVNVSMATIEEDGDLMATRWRLKGGGESLEMFADEAGSGVLPPGEDRLLLDESRDYRDEFVDAADELQELQKRAVLMLSATVSPVRWFTEVKAAPEVFLEPGDAVVIASPALEGDPRVSEEFELFARVQSVQYSEGETTVTLLDRDVDDAPIMPRRTFGRTIRDIQGSVTQLGMR